jgi:hypothetical protein
MYRRAMVALAARIGDTHPFVSAACDAGRASGLEAGNVCAD